MPRIDERSWKKIFELGNNGKYDDEAYAEILATVLNLRVEKGLTQSDVARISGLSTSMVSKIESQYTVPSVKNFLRYIFALDLDWELVHKR
ncbi:helix-turn-helix domain-containing protein [Lactiplantibacillus pentosus]|uniref:helix-turn-helix domain-containing protein n=1 Tax=Lactiplantibacillus pentosus TaxID=1589 RepID=UPI001C1F00F4|nr:helix-turn-helix transcriptional regulator [Lactiplantibacillus pentosus]MBU7478957.1 helix-turn-helix transcriptional regulator [Lactiplantibacillus pentosus]MBU7536749.1 helix-turn-helix transcriptional regulator [Lactiplantibacillus pentosus]